MDCIGTELARDYVEGIIDFVTRPCTEGEKSIHEIVPELSHLDRSTGQPECDRTISFNNLQTGASSGTLKGEENKCKQLLKYENRELIASEDSKKFSFGQRRSNRNGTFGQSAQEEVEKSSGSEADTIEMVGNDESDENLNYQSPVRENHLAQPPGGIFWEVTSNGEILCREISPRIVKSQCERVDFLCFEIIEKNIQKDEKGMKEKLIELSKSLDTLKTVRKLWNKQKYNFVFNHRSDSDTSDEDNDNNSVIYENYLQAKRGISRLEEKCKMADSILNHAFFHDETKELFPSPEENHISCRFTTCFDEDNDVLRMNGNRCPFTQCVPHENCRKSEPNLNDEETGLTFVRELGEGIKRAESALVKLLKEVEKDMCTSVPDPNDKENIEGHINSVLQSFNSLSDPQVSHSSAFNCLDQEEQIMERLENSRDSLVPKERKTQRGGNLEQQGSSKDLEFLEDISVLQEKQMTISNLLDDLVWVAETGETEPQLLVPQHEMLMNCQHKARPSQEPCKTNLIEMSGNAQPGENQRNTVFNHEISDYPIAVDFGMLNEFGLELEKSSDEDLAVIEAPKVTSASYRESSGEGSTSQGHTSLRNDDLPNQPEKTENSVLHANSLTSVDLLAESNLTERNDIKPGEKITVNGDQDAEEKTYLSPLNVGLNITNGDIENSTEGAEKQELNQEGSISGDFNSPPMSVIIPNVEGSPTTTATMVQEVEGVSPRSSEYSQRENYPCTHFLEGTIPGQGLVGSPTSNAPDKFPNKCLSEEKTGAFRLSLIDAPPPFEGLVTESPDSLESDFESKIGSLHLEGDTMAVPEADLSKEVESLIKIHKYEKNLSSTTRYTDLPQKETDITTSGSDECLSHFKELTTTSSGFFSTVSSLDEIKVCSGAQGDDKNRVEYLSPELEDQKEETPSLTVRGSIWSRTVAWTIGGFRQT